MSRRNVCKFNHIIGGYTWISSGSRHSQPVFFSWTSATSLEWLSRCTCQQHNAGQARVRKIKENPKRHRKYLKYVFFLFFCIEKCSFWEFWDKEKFKLRLIKLNPNWVSIPGRGRRPRGKYWLPFLTKIWPTPGRSWSRGKLRTTHWSRFYHYVPNWKRRLWGGAQGKA